MRELTLNKNVGFFTGLPWYLATEFGQMDKHDDHYDICKVIRYFLQGFILTIVMTLVLSMVMMPVVQMIAWVSFMVLNKIWISPNAAFIVSWAVVIVLSLVFLAVYSGIKVTEFMRDVERGRVEEGLALSIYMAIKNKTCVKVNFK